MWSMILWKGTTSKKIGRRRSKTKHENHPISWTLDHEAPFWRERWARTSKKQVVIIEHHVNYWGNNLLFVSLSLWMRWESWWDEMSWDVLSDYLSSEDIITTHSSEFVLCPLFEAIWGSEFVVWWTGQRGVALYDEIRKKPRGFSFPSRECGESGHYRSSWCFASYQQPKKER